MQGPFLSAFSKTLLTYNFFLFTFLVPLRHVVSQPGCLDDESQSSSLTFHCLPQKATINYIKCSRASSQDSENWKHVYTFISSWPDEDQGVPADEFKDRVSHIWKKDQGRFILTILKPTLQDAMWYQCVFDSVGQHRKRKSFVELKYRKDGIGE